MNQMNQKTGRARQLTGFTILALLAAVLLFNAFFTFSYSRDANYRNVSIDTRVNVTHARPEVLTVTCDKPITLVAGTYRTVTCNATIRVWSGPSEIANVKGIFWDANNASLNSSDLHTNHYTNATCYQNFTYATYYANYTCNFSVYYNADNGTNWTANLTATSSYPFNGTVTNWSSNSNTTIINQLLALNVTSLIDYGNLAVGDTSAAQQANVTNFGNININVSVRGYGNTSNDSLAFVCQFNNISIANEKYSLNATADFATQYVALSSNFTIVNSLMLPQQQNDSQQVINNTYWRLYVPPNPFGQCNGTVVFQAEYAGP
jgi:hypothetical protein